jgi:drug/metabolite transporter (DMT)-like permease
MAWFYLSLGSALSFASLTLLSRVVSVKSKNPRALSIVFNLTAFLMAMMIFFITGANKNFSLPTKFEPYLYLFIACLFYGLYDRLRFYVAQILEASLVSIINNVSLVVAFFVAAFIYSEIMTINKIGGFLLILTALFLVSVNKVSKINLRGIFLAILINVFLGFGWALDKKGVIFFNSEIYNILVWFFPLFIIYFPYVKFSDIKKEIKISSWKITLLSFLNVVGYFIQLKALALADATRVITIVQTSTLFTVIFGIILLKEKENIPRKILAGIIAVIGVYFLTH